ncbi:WhiB family transcriptional regulator [Streptomyces sp. TS71-3]|uniref:WhiB family transcriptional regulator n=1 Tax=Streptomyces sp. TS71-3 TaxID=2733862 RepID=UPI001BB3D7EA|nr:WhiB family transcriptional regulator [Streptomyces sp. TS71-3]
MDWRQYAACRNEDTELFFPIGTRGASLRQAQEAKKVCHGCPVAEPCLRFALESGQRYGIWGGLDEDERERLARRNRRRQRIS